MVLRNEASWFFSLLPCSRGFSFLTCQPNSVVLKIVGDNLVCIRFVVLFVVSNIHCYILDFLRALLTGDDDGSNLNKFLGKVEYLLKLCFTNAVTCFGPAEHVQIQTAYCTKDDRIVV